MVAPLTIIFIAVQSRPTHWSHARSGTKDLPSEEHIRDRKRQQPNASGQHRRDLSAVRSQPRLEPRW